MDQNRKNIIVKEILFWKKSRLLPEKYCDFLITLYTEGNQDTFEKEKRSSILDSILLLFLVLLVPSAILVIYFTELSFVLQTVILIFSVCICLLFFYLFKGEERSFIHVIRVVFAILFFFIQVHISTYLSHNNQWLLSIVILANCLGWIVIGKKRKQNYFYISGIIGIIIFVLVLLRNGIKYF